MTTINDGGPAFPARIGEAAGRLAERPYLPGDTLPAVRSYCLVSGANSDIESDQHRGYRWRQVLGYSDDLEFVCMQTHTESDACWPTVERLSNCWFAEVPHPMAGYVVARAEESVARAQLGVYA
ncbi:hypothetical protein [Bordetella bronchiseptica]|uniref:Uncharacterized protein n=1 Tax=Bordetella bronchiseptica 00-P-2796 TaxID=1331199 RepID=A0ABR4RET1_BORBO|nr:hypothetical protein [Bordetella bronchiseptica]AWP85757.1 hypothetical protein B7P00_17225 [Bordetella bronchiseptica]KCV34114.1 hypothetical protein L490_3357 [Bordetella bronchiseptica 00-P-2796]KDC18968.1 hypothetical protein L542_3662 [Bordetella bronchiseptica F-1]KDC26280.1 hypothetical protein L504_3684 [Bordetella bronchiseptica F2]